MSRRAVSDPPPSEGAGVCHAAEPLPAAEEHADRLMTQSYSEICHGDSSGRSSVLECGTDTLLSDDRSPATPEHQLPADFACLATGTVPSAALLDALEGDARRVAAAADAIIEGLTGTMHSISSLAVETMDVYRSGVCKTCDGIDANIKAMYQVMAKTEELNKTVKQVHPLAGQVRELKRLLDLFESAVLSAS